MEFEETISNYGLVSTIPQCMKQILSAVGYNSAYSLLTITDQKLDELEAYIEQNLREVVDSIDVYKLKKPFQFLPGHRALIFGIKEELIKHSGNKVSKPGSRKPSSQQASRDNLSANDLRISLENQLSSYANNCLAKFGLKTHYIVNEVKLTQSENQTFAQCVVTCPNCLTINHLRYDKYWKTSNVFKHIRSHILLSETESDKNDEPGKSTAEDDDDASMSAVPKEKIIKKVKNDKIIKILSVIELPPKRMKTIKMNSANGEGEMTEEMIIVDDQHQLNLDDGIVFEPNGYESNDDEYNGDEED